MTGPLPGIETWLAWRATLPPVPAVLPAGPGATKARIRAALAAVQQNLCALCLAPGKFLELDHEHETGFARGMLCRGCNVLEGRIRFDSPDHAVVAAYRANPPAAGADWFWDYPEVERMTMEQAIAALLAVDLPPLGLARPLACDESPSPSPLPADPPSRRPRRVLGKPVTIAQAVAALGNVDLPPLS